MKPVEKSGHLIWNTKIAKFILVLGFLLLVTHVVTAAEKIPFYQDDTIADIRDKIVANGYQFTVSDNWVTHLPAAERRKLLSRHAPLIARHRFGKVDSGPLRVNLLDELPDSFDWRNFQGHSYIGLVRTQGVCGACYAFGACAAAEGTYNVCLR